MLRITFTDEGDCETNVSQCFIAERRSDRLSSEIELCIDHELFYTPL